MRVGLLWRLEWDPPKPDPTDRRLHGVFDAFAELGVDAEPVVYSDDVSGAVLERLVELDGVLVWVNPIERGLSRDTLDAVLRDAAARGVWVSAHPDVIRRLATKLVLHETRDLSWGSDTRVYRSPAELRVGIPARLAERARVLKQERGMGGDGVWKVELVEAVDDPVIRVQHADGDGETRELRLSAFVEGCARYFANGRVMVEQPYNPRIVEGMTRAYLSHDEVVGFARQYPRGLRPDEAGEPPAGKVFRPGDAPELQPLRERLEQEWVPQLRARMQLEPHTLPVIWDADFLGGPQTTEGIETYELCEINASSTFAFPEHAMPTVARNAIARIREHAAASSGGRGSTRPARPRD